MVICPIAMAVHCTGCPFVKFCPAKTILGDYGKDSEEKSKKAPEQQNDPGESSGNEAGTSK